MFKKTNYCDFFFLNIAPTIANLNNELRFEE